MDRLGVRGLAAAALVICALPAMAMRPVTATEGGALVGGACISMAKSDPGKKCPAATTSCWTGDECQAVAVKKCTDRATGALVLDWSVLTGNLACAPDGPDCVWDLRLTYVKHQLPDPVYGANCVAGLPTDSCQYDILTKCATSVEYLDSLCHIPAGGTPNIDWYTCGCMVSVGPGGPPGGGLAALVESN